MAIKNVALELMNVEVDRRFEFFLFYARVAKFTNKETFAVSMPDLKRTGENVLPTKVWCEKPGVGYIVKCKDWNDVFLGETFQYIYKRLDNHFNSIKNNKSHAFALAKHALEKCDCFNFQHPKIFAFENDNA